MQSYMQCAKGHLQHIDSQGQDTTSPNSCDLAKRRIQGVTGGVGILIKVGSGCKQ